MGAGGLFSGIIEGYSQSMLRKHKEERDAQEKGQQAELNVLKAAVDTGQLGPDELRATFARMEEITSEMTGGGKKKKGGFSLGNLIGKFGDVGGQSQGGAASGGKGGSAQTGAAAAAPAAPAPGAQPAQGATGSTPQKFSLGQMPFRSRTDMVTEEEKARVKAQIDAKDEEFKKKLKENTDAYLKSHPQATQREVFDNVEAQLRGIKTPETKYKNVVVKTPDGESHPAVEIPGRPGYFDANTLEPLKDAELADKPGKKKEPTIKESAGYPYIATGDPEKDLAAAEAAFKKGTATKEQERALADARTARRQTYTAQATTLKANLSDASKQLATAKKDLESKEKEIRAASKGIESSILATKPDVVKAKAAIKEAQQKVDNGKKAVQYVDQMRLAVEEGTVDLNAVTAAAQELAEKGYTTAPPPGNVTRKVK
jgi:hypothetical protein